MTFDLSTSEGGRGYIAELFRKRLNTHSYTRYITERLAADFACALAQWFEENHPLDAQEPVELLASRMVKAWALAHGRPAPWATAVEIMATITKQSDAEKAALLALDEQSHPDLVGYCREKNIQRMRAGGLSGFMVEDEQHGEACIALFTRPAKDEPSDVQQLRTILEEVRQQRDEELRTSCALEKERDDSRAQLAEAHALLTELEGDHTLMLQMGASEFGPTECKTLRARLVKLRTYLRVNALPAAEILVALSASAEPRSLLITNCSEVSGFLGGPVDVRNLPPAPVEIDEWTIFPKKANEE